MTNQNESPSSLLLFLQAGPDASETPKNQGERRYRKDVIRCGRWYVPHLEMWLEIDEARMDRWVEQFEVMQSKGVSVDLTLDHQTGAESRRGELLKLYREDQTLFMEVEVSDEASELLIQRCPQVSLELQRQFIDGQGHHYEEALTAVSIVRHPVACDQGEFESLDSTDEERVSIHASCEARQACFALAQPAQSILPDDQTKESDSDTEVMQLSLLQSAQRDRLGRLCDLRLEQLCESGRISPAVLQSCRDLLEQGKDTARVMLSAQVNGLSLAESWLDVLEQLPERNWEMQSGAQLLVLPDALKQQEGELTRQMIDEANRHGQYQV